MDNAKLCVGCRAPARARGALHARKCPKWPGQAGQNWLGKSGCAPAEVTTLALRSINTLQLALPGVDSWRPSQGWPDPGRGP